MTTFLELGNLVLSELGYAQKQDFTDFTTREELEILRKISNKNSKVVLAVKTNYRVRSTTITIPANTTTLFSSVLNNVNGEVKLQTGGIIDTINKEKYAFVPQHEKFLLGEVSGANYGYIGDSFLFAPYSTDRTLTIYYYTYDSAKRYNNETLIWDDITNLTLGDDTSILPQQVCQDILVNGVCFELKKRTDNTRLAYWNEQYKEAMKQLRTFAETEDLSSQFIISNENQSFVRNIV